MKAYDCDGQELSVGDDVIYVGINTGYPDTKIGELYKILGFDFGVDDKGDERPGLIFSVHPFPIYVFSLHLSDARSSVAEHYKKIDYSKKLNVLESDQIQYKPTQQFQ